jgi:hypothetical protein
MAGWEFAAKGGSEGCLGAPRPWGEVGEVGEPVVVLQAETVEARAFREAAPAERAQARAFRDATALESAPQARTGGRPVAQGIRGQRGCEGPAARSAAGKPGESFPWPTIALVVSVKAYAFCVLYVLFLKTGLRDGATGFWHEGSGESV